jgi:hypothetical protein
MIHMKLLQSIGHEFTDLLLYNTTMCLNIAISLSWNDYNQKLRLDLIRELLLGCFSVDNLARSSQKLNN